jgi:hypothetical protein
MSCNDPKKTNEDAARAALEAMDELTIKTMADLMEATAKRHPRPARAQLKIVKKTQNQKPRK